MSSPFLLISNRFGFFFWRDNNILKVNLIKIFPFYTYSFFKKKSLIQIVKPVMIQLDSLNISCSPRPYNLYRCCSFCLEHFSSHSLCQANLFISQFKHRLCSFNLDSGNIRINKTNTVPYPLEAYLSWQKPSPPCPSLGWAPLSHSVPVFLLNKTLIIYN